MKIKIFTTGGTIDKLYFDALSEYQVGDPEIEQVLRHARIAVDFEIEPLMRKDSLDLTDEDRERIAGAVESERCTHVLVTHGTDTMTRTARRLKEIGGKTIVLTGSLMPVRFRETDAVFNIGFAIAVVQMMPPGVYIAMNGRVFDPDRSEKNRDRNRFEEIEPGQACSPAE